ncbi:SP_0198 family lipoprotein [Streptococcus marmotae]|uniref:SP_0198 family lipoprotein n=1 Tax=Streptococcus marmotae TaxID=1825069 RepID=UPI00082A1C52|nr:SP_0198 family lipoprotein [Streptococcus marmotae]
MNLTKLFSFATVTALGLVLVACSRPTNQATPASSTTPSSEAMTSQSSATASSSTTASTAASTPAQTSNLDGTYKGNDEEDQVTLVITGTTGTWTQVEPDGEQEIKNVTIDPTNQRITIGDDVERYFLEGNQLTIEDISEVDFNDKVVLTKQ